MGVCDYSMFCCTLLYFICSITIILVGKRELVTLLNLSSWCLVMVEWLFLAVPWGCLQFVIVVFPNHTHLLFFVRVLTIYTIVSCYPLQTLLTQSRPNKTFKTLMVFLVSNVIKTGTTAALSQKLRFKHVFMCIGLVCSLVPYQ